MISSVNALPLLAPARALKYSASTRTDSDYLRNAIQVSRDAIPMGNVPMLPPLLFQGDRPLLLSYSPNEHRLKIRPQKQSGFTHALYEDDKLIGRFAIGEQHRAEVYAGPNTNCVKVSSTIIDQPLHYYVFPGSVLTLSDGTHVKMDGSLEPIEALKNVQPRPTTDSAQTYTTQAYIPSAGQGSRLYPLTALHAKPTLPLSASQNTLALLIKHLSHHNISTVIVDAYANRTSIDRTINGIQGENPTMDIFTHHEDDLRGYFFHGLQKILNDQDALTHLDLDKPLVLVLGDSVTNMDISALVNAHVENNAGVTIGVKTPTKYETDHWYSVSTGETSPDGRSGEVTDYWQPGEPLPKDRPYYATTGLYVVSPAVLKNIDRLVKIGDDKKMFFPNVTAELLGTDGKPLTIYAKVLDGYYRDIGLVSSYLQTIRELAKGKIFPREITGDSCVDQQSQAIYLDDSRDAASTEIKKICGNIIVSIKAFEHPGAFSRMA